MNALIKTACEQFERKLAAAIADATREELDKKAGLFNLFANAKKDTFNARQVEADRLGYKGPDELAAGRAKTDFTGFSDAQWRAHPKGPGEFMQARNARASAPPAAGGDLVQAGADAVKQKNAPGGDAVSIADQIAQ